MPSRRWIAAVALLATACDKGEISVRKEDPDRPADYGHGKLMAAVQEMAGKHDSAPAYRTFYDQVEALRPQFSESVADIAELHLVFLAVPPLDAMADRPPAEQLDALATTVWPAALGVRPKPDEPPRAYVERICVAELALECKYVVPEYWGLVLSQLVWRRLEDRARDAYRGCAPCKADPKYQAAIDRLHQRQEGARELLGRHSDNLHPKAWPTAQTRGSDWTDLPLLELAKGGALTLDGVPVAAGGLRGALLATREDRTVLGVHLRPEENLGALRSLAVEAAGVGYRALAIQARGAEYPWQLREYRVAIGKGAPRTWKVAARDVDSIQMLVQALDLMRAEGPDPPALNERGAARRH